MTQLSASTMRKGRLAGLRALVLGVSPGNIGEAIARRFFEHGARVAVSGRRAAELARVAKEVQGYSRPCDICDPSQVEQLVDEVASHLGGIDIGVNAVGWGLFKAFLDHTPEDLAKIAAIQFTGPFVYFQELLRVMRNPGSLIQISSAMTVIPTEHHAAYISTKSALDQVIRCIANEFGGQGIRANSIAPSGVADAPMSRGALLHERFAQAVTREIPLGRVGVRSDVADAALWLASRESSFVTGQIIHVSGGQTLRRNLSLAEASEAFGPSVASP